MGGYNKLKVLIFAFLVVYFVGGLSTEVFLKGKQKEFIPFFSWFLFDYVPNEKRVNKYSVRISEYANKKINPPILYENAYGIVDTPQSPKARELILRLGKSLERGNKIESQRLRQLLEQIYLPRPVRYEIVIVTYQPLLRFESGEYETKKIAEFESI
jgi:hypothetical protein